MPFEGARTGIDVLGMCAPLTWTGQKRLQARLPDRRTARDAGRPVARERVRANCDYVGGVYAVPTPGMAKAVSLLARTGDPLYSGKGMAALIDLVRKEYFEKEENVVFLHTGGSAALFGYTEVFAGGQVLAMDRGIARRVSVPLPTRAAGSGRFRDVVHRLAAQRAGGRVGRIEPEVSA
ncbi:MAG: hypothetical protein ABI781_18215 [Burkholderiales bacterium]